MEDQKTNNRWWLPIGLLVGIAVLTAVVYMAVKSNQTNFDQQQNSVETKQPTPTQNDSQSTTSNETSSQGTEIVFSDNGFDKDNYTVKVNQLVTVKNNSSQDMQFSSADHPTHEDQPELNLSILSPGASASFRSTIVGTWGFHDHIKDQFKGTLIVTE